MLAAGAAVASVTVSVPAGQTAQVIPPDGKDRPGQFQWEIVNPTGSGGAVELVDAASKTVGGGRPVAAGANWQGLGRDLTMWAANGGGSAVVVIVTGTAYGD